MMLCGTKGFVYTASEKREAPETKAQESSVQSSDAAPRGVGRVC
jgi:hypothetical protein